MVDVDNRNLVVCCVLFLNVLVVFDLLLCVFGCKCLNRVNSRLRKCIVYFDYKIGMYDIVLFLFIFINFGKFVIII